MFLVTSAIENGMDLVAIVVSVGLVLIENLLTAVTLLLPTAVLNFCGSIARDLLPHNEEEIQLEEDPVASETVNKVANAISVVEICDIFGYVAEEHVVATADGYLLGLHRIVGRKGRERTENKPVVYLHHGLLMNSEVWVAVPDKKLSIAFALSAAGYDVWLGNNRGNKYSKKHLVYNSNSIEFWNFGLDEFALYDIPAMIDYILTPEITSATTLAYIGFSQGSAQAFAALSTQPKLNAKVNVFIALGPAMAPPGINPIIQSLVNASPSLLYMTFGQRIILRSAIFWQSIMILPLFVRAIDFALYHLFRWNGHNISWAQRLTGYSHLYSYTSVKSVVHWFQIIKTQSFQMYDDDTFGPFSTKAYRFCRVPPYPTTNITSPIEIIYGSADTLLDIDALVAKLPTQKISLHEIEDYEHLDMIWGRAVPTVIIPKILDIVRAYIPEEQRPVKKRHTRRPSGSTSTYNQAAMRQRKLK